MRRARSSRGRASSRWLKHGSGLAVEQRMRLCRPRSARHSARCSDCRRARSPCACTLTESIPKILAKTPSASRVTLTVIVSLASVPAREGELAGAATVRAEVLRRERARGAGALGQLLSGGKRGCVRGRLGRALLAEPRADVEHQRDRAEQRGQEDDAEDGGLAGLAAKTVHSTRSVVSDFEVAGRHDEPEQVDLVGVGGLDRDGLAVLPRGRVDGRRRASRRRGRWRSSGPPPRPRRPDSPRAG